MNWYKRASSHDRPSTLRYRFTSARTSPNGTNVWRVNCSIFFNRRCYDLSFHGGKNGEWRQWLLKPIRGENPALANLSTPLQIIAEQGTLATRIQTGLGPKFSEDDLVNVYGQLADCLEQWQPFTP